MPVTSTTGIASGPGQVTELIDVEGNGKSAALNASPPQIQASLYPGGLPIDVSFEASKLPLDVAIFNSTRAAGGDEKIKKYLQAVLIVGGTARITGMAQALESRYVVSPQ